MSPVVVTKFMNLFQFLVVRKVIGMLYFEFDSILVAKFLNFLVIVHDIKTLDTGIFL